MAPVTKRRKKESVGSKGADHLPPKKRTKASKSTNNESLDVKKILTKFRDDEGELKLHVEMGTAEEKLWPLLKSKSLSDDEWSNACRLLALLVTNKEGKPSADFFADDTETLSRVIRILLLADGTQGYDHSILNFFIILLVASVDVRKALTGALVGVEILHFIGQGRLELELMKSAGLRRAWADAPKKPKKLWIVEWIQSLVAILEGTSECEDVLQDAKHSNGDVWKYLHRSSELLIDLLSAFETRQYLILYLEATHFVVRCRMAMKQCPRNSHSLLRSLLSRVYSLMAFPVQADKKPLSKADVVTAYHSRATIVQKMCHRHFSEDVEEVIYAGVGLLCNGKFIQGAMSGLADDKLLNLLTRLRLLEPGNFSGDRQLMLAILSHYVTLPAYPLDRLKSFPLYPTESILFDHNAIPPAMVLRKTPILAVSKLQTQFLSFQDYLLRNFELVRLESAYDIRSDIVDVVKRVKPVVRQIMQDSTSESRVKTEMTGWARMALEINEPPRIMRVTPPKLGEAAPAQVVAELTIDLVHCGDSIRREWDSLGEFDNLFLIAIDAKKATGAPAPLQTTMEESYGMKSKDTDNDRRVPDAEDPGFPQRFGVTAIRGCMVLNVRDENGNELSNSAHRDKQVQIKGTKRIFRVQLDSAQYTADTKRNMDTDVYQTLNLVVRRHGRENNFRSILETIRGLMEGSGSISRVIPSWLQPVILGYGDPKMANYTSDTIRNYSTKTPGVAKPDAPLDFHDTFLDREHLQASFPEKEVTFDKSDADLGDGRRNHRLTFTGASTIKASSYEYPSDQVGNPVRFTPVQVEAIKSGLSPGVSLIVGPPGTGKSDVAVQIIANLYHSFPTQRTVIVTHSNAALNDLFEKIMARGDIDERYMIRLGSGESELDVESSHDFTRAGRVSHSLSRRGELLEKVQQLSESLGISRAAERGEDGKPSYTCQSAKYFQAHYVVKRVAIFQRLSKTEKNFKAGQNFPFPAFFNLDQSALDNLTLEDANAKIESISKIFAELEEYRPLELLRSQRQRVDYFLMKQARIVAMTCTHAAIARSRLIAMDFQYDNIVMEEAAQMTEVETFIPLVLQRGETNDSSSVSRLKRICLIGDHHQLPPVIKNRALATYSNLDQSLFARMIGFGVPHIQLNRQGRTRPAIADLFRWRYNELGDLQHVVSSPQYEAANAGFVHTHQIVDVENYEGKGETSPSTGYYQNLGEAEYAVALFQFMVLIGYPSEKISILTTYNGQKALIMDILRQRCGGTTGFAGASPKTVSTVDQYQGQQNDYIILSLVRTTSVGYMRDIRRMIVAVSRARLGLYILCRKSLFTSCHAVTSIMNQLNDKPSNLEIVVGEHYPSCDRKAASKLAKKDKFAIEDVAHLGSIVHAMQAEWMEEK